MQLYLTPFVMCVYKTQVLTSIVPSTALRFGRMRLHYPNGRCLPLFVELDDAAAADSDAIEHCVILLNVQLPRCPQ